MERLILFHSDRPYGTAAGVGQRDVTCFPVQERCDGYAASQMPVLLSGVQPAELNLVSSVGNVENPTEHRCGAEVIKQWNQQLTRQVAHRLVVLCKWKMMLN